MSFKNSACIFLVLSLLIIGCGRSTSKHPFSGHDFPTQCSDSENKGETNLKQDVHPVYIDYSVENFEIISKRICSGPYPPNIVLRQDANKESVEVAFFNTIERANIFREVISSKFPSAEVGKSITLQSVIDSRNIGKTDHFLKYRASSTSFPEIYKDDLENLKTLIDKDSWLGRKNQIALPTYIPYRFRVESVRAKNSKSFMGYTVTYRSKFDVNLSCFSISGGYDAWNIDDTGGAKGGRVESSKSLIVSSPPLGNVRLDYVSFDRMGDQSHISFRKRVPESSSSNHYSMTSCKDGISLSEAVKIVESIRFLSP
jgi:hypothetical protein